MNEHADRDRSEQPPVDLTGWEDGYANAGSPGSPDAAGGGQGDPVHEPVERQLYRFWAVEPGHVDQEWVGWWRGHTRTWYSIFGDGMWSEDYVTRWEPVDVSGAASLGSGGSRRDGAESETSSRRNAASPKERVVADGTSDLYFRYDLRPESESERWERLQREGGLLVDADGQVIGTLAPAVLTGDGHTMRFHVRPLSIEEPDRG